MSVSRSIYLIEIDAWTGSRVETLYLGTRTITTSPSDTPANTVYHGYIMDAGKFSTSITLNGDAPASFGAIMLNNLNGALDSWFNYGFDGREYRLKELLHAGMPISSAVLLSKGVIEGIDGSDALKTLRLKLLDKLSILDLPLLTDRFAGTTLSGSDLTAEGNDNLKGQIKQRVYGFVQNITAQQVNDFYLIQQWTDHGASMINPFDGLVPLSFAGDYGSLASLILAPVSGGFYATCLALGLTKLGQAPVDKLTANVADIMQANITDGGNSAARVAQRMLADFGVTDIDTASFDALRNLNAAVVGVLVNDETSARDAIKSILSSIGGILVAGSHGTMRAIAYVDPAPLPAVDSYTQRDIANNATFAVGAGLENSQDAVPAWSVVLHFERFWQTMSLGDMATSISSGNIDQATIDNYALGYRTATAQDATVKTAHLKAQQIVQDTLLVNRSDAEAEALRRLNLQKVRRDNLSASLIEFDKGKRRELGDVVRVTTDRLGQRGGKNFLVVGISLDFEKRVATLNLWG